MKRALTHVLAAALGTILGALAASLAVPDAAPAFVCPAASVEAPAAIVAPPEESP